MALGKSSRQKTRADKHGKVGKLTSSHASRRPGRKRHAGRQAGRPVKEKRERRRGGMQARRAKEMVMLHGDPEGTFQHTLGWLDAWLLSHLAARAAHTDISSHSCFRPEEAAATMLNVL